MRKIENALNIAIHAHDNTLDKAGKPYILHPLAVMMSKTPEILGVTNSPTRAFTPDEMCVAILHDVKEDCDTVYWEDICEIFSNYPEIIAAIDAISKRKNETLDDYYKRVKNNEMALRVKLADMEHNMSYERIFCIDSKETRERLIRKYHKGYSILTSIE